jgi:hypothetical protein
VLLSDRIVMMTNGPAATIGEILPIKLDRPRDRLALAEDREFVHLRQQVLAFLYAKHVPGKPPGQAAAETQIVATAGPEATPIASAPVDQQSPRLAAVTPELERSDARGSTRSDTRTDTSKDIEAA